MSYSLNKTDINTLKEYYTGLRQRMNVSIFAFIYVICAAT